MTECFETWCWPCPPKPFVAPPKYVAQGICKIPTGSLYFASRKGPLSEVSARITGSPYDMIGIIFQSKTRNKEGTYVFTIDSFIDKVVVIDLASLIKNDAIIHHAVLPLKDFGEIEVDWSEQSEHKGNDCKDFSDWKIKLRETRIEILKMLFKKYCEFHPEYDAYQNLASMVGLSINKPKRVNHAFTAAELVGRILFEAGLIWDRRFAFGNINPICQHGKYFFQRLAEDCDRKSTDHEAIVILTTPRYHAVRKQAAHFIQRKDQDLTESEEIDKFILDNIKKYLEESTGPEKGGPAEDSESDSETTDDCCYPSKWIRNSEHKKMNWWKPVRKPVYAQTLSFRSLRPIDFLSDYYQNSSIDRSSYSDLTSNLTRVRGKASELVSLMMNLYFTLNKQRNIECEINQLNMCWFHNNLVPIELCNDSNNDCEDQVNRECEILKKSAIKLSEDLLTRQSSDLDPNCLTGNLLAKICKRTSELAAKLHALAREVDVVVEYNGKIYEIDECEYQNENEKNNEYKFKVSIDRESDSMDKYLIILHKYMWKKGWSYQYQRNEKEPVVVSWSQSKYEELYSRATKLYEDFVDLKEHTPVSCIILELVIYLLEQTGALQKYISSCQKYCYKDKTEG
jgi:hypothetical protein